MYPIHVMVRQRCGELGLMKTLWLARRVKKNARGNDSVWDGCHGSPNGVLVFGIWGMGE